MCDNDRPLIPVAPAPAPAAKISRPSAQRLSVSSLPHNPVHSVVVVPLETNDLTKFCGLQSASNRSITVVNLGGINTEPQGDKW